MEYQQIITLLDKTPYESTKFRVVNVLKQMMTHVKCIALVVKLNLKLRC